MKSAQRKKIAKAIRLIDESYVSHLDWSVGPQLKKECCNKAVGSRRFHFGCLSDYHFIRGVLQEFLK